jgi:hypothetical protein
MLLWKSWRDLRIAFFVGLGWLALLAVIALRHAPIITTTRQPVAHGPRLVDIMVAGILLTLTVSYAFAALAMGTFGVGRNIGEGSGSFVLTRPVPRRHFVWIEWASGLAALGALLLVSVLVLWAAIHWHAFRIDFSFNNPPHVYQRWIPSSMPFAPAGISAICDFLFLALVFGITHLGSVAFRHSTAGLLFGGGFLVAWLVVTTILSHEYPWMAPHIPSLILRPSGAEFGTTRLTPSLTASILERLAILPLFPLLAQLFLRRTEV